MSADEVVTFYDADASEGLPEREVGARRQRFGANVLPRPEPRSRMELALEQLASLPVALLAGSAVLSVATGGLADALAILGVVGLNAAIGFSTESQAEATIRTLLGGPRPPASVRREGRRVTIPAEALVPGDLLVLTPGTYVDADARLVEARRLSVDESALTGESAAVPKGAERIEKEDTPLADRHNMVYMGTIVTGGTGTGVVVATGPASEMGQIEGLTGAARPPESPAQRQLAQMGRQLVGASLAVCGGVFGVGLLRGIGLVEMLRSSVSLAVAAVPEGLPTVAMSTLALGIRSLRRHGVLVRHIDAVETIGAVQVVCLDKTGTITLNRMTLVAAHAGGRSLEVREGAFHGADGRLGTPLPPELARLLEVCVLCSEVELAEAPDGLAFHGSATETALVRAALEAGLDPAALRARRETLLMEPRSERQRFMRSEHAADDGLRFVAMKGDPNEVLGHCETALHDGELRHLGDALRREIVAENERMAGDALRVLGVAMAEVKQGEISPRDGLTWLGLAGLADPIRPGIDQLVARLHGAGIETIMITGDQGGTAYAVARKLDLSAGKPLEMLDAGEIERLPPEILSALASRVRVFSRVTPAHKLEIVRALQRAGLVVAMTGDGINDGPALKAADIGVALGGSGTEVARLVADVVLRDDRLETLLRGIAQGRAIHENIRAAIRYLLSTNLSEILVVLGALVAGLGQPLGPLQLLWLNLVSDVFPALGLAMEPPAEDVLRRPPLDPMAPIVTRRDWTRIGFEAATMSASTLGVYALAVGRYGPGPRASTVASASLGFAQLAHALSCRSETESLLATQRQRTNRSLTGALALSAALQAAAFVPPLRGILGNARLSLADLPSILAGAVVPLFANEATKGRIGRPAAPRAREEEP
jgi:Ca2+-transporting ATPase